MLAVHLKLRAPLTALALLMPAIAPAPLRAGGGPQNVAVVVNPNDPDSMAIANAYVELRVIPSSNVFYVPWSATTPRTSAAAFGDRLLKPLFDQIRKRNLDEQINCIAYSTGFPFIIDCTELFSGRQFPPQARPITSLTSATFFNHCLLDGRPDLFGLDSNPYFSPTNEGRTRSTAFPAPGTSSPASAANPGSPAPFILATALGVTHGRGNTAAEIIACLKRAQQADGTKPAGTIYYLQNGDVRSQVRQATYPAAVQELAAVGVKAEVVRGALPAGKHDVAGFTTGAARLNLRNAKITLLPGALVDNLTSSGAQFTLPLTPASQTPISEFIRLGAAGASGTVVEPFAIAAKFPSAALHVHYARGSSLAESYYQAVAAPGNLLVVGDPLCQPWAVKPLVSVAEVTEGAVLKDVFKATPAAAFPDGRKVDHFEFFVDGSLRQSVPPGGSFTSNTASWADGWHELRVAAFDDTPIAVQGHWIANVQIRNGEQEIQLRSTSQRVPLGGMVLLELQTPAHSDATVLHNQQRLGLIKGGAGQVSVPAAKLGKGRIEIYAQQQGDGRLLRSKPISVEVY
ncbi:MAG: TIGR03790 family protein [Pirellulales bacterium]|nr:TIGR03790 family protein [Pirellulales bacterium]